MRILNLGAGVQSTTIYLMMIDGDIEPADVAIFADTGDEPQAVYDHLTFLSRLDGPEIFTVSAGNLGDNLIRGVNGTGQRFVSIPAFLSRHDDGTNTGIGRRQCTKEFKIVPIEAEIRRLLGVKPKCRLPKDVTVTEVFGLSFDEPKRVARVRSRFRQRKQWNAEFPLFDEFMTRDECRDYLKSRVPNIYVPRSACVFCPYRCDDEWIELQKNDPDGFARAVEIDKAIRDPASACTRGLESTQYLHRSCIPLDQVEFAASPPDRQGRFRWSEMDCEGMCGV